MSITKHIPNFITSLNILCGVFATFFAISGQPQVSVWLIFAGSIFDFTDGFAARAFNAYSDIGKDMDSLADLISFGLAPAAIWSAIIKSILVGDISVPFSTIELIDKIWILSPFVMVVFAALRLAKFNTDTRQTENFLGLTTTATGIFTASFAYYFFHKPQFFEWLSPIVIMAMVIVFCVLLVSEIPMFSLKFKNFKWGDNKERFILLGISLLFIVLFGPGGIAATILYYVAVSIIKWILGTKAK